MNEPEKPRNDIVILGLALLALLAGCGAIAVVALLAHQVLG
jgi:hypothetical protein